MSSQSEKLNEWLEANKNKSLKTLIQSAFNANAQFEIPDDIAELLQLNAEIGTLTSDVMLAGEASFKAGPLRLVVDDELTLSIKIMASPGSFGTLTKDVVAGTLEIR